VSEPSPDSALDRTLRAARDKREQRGASGDGRIVLPQLKPEEALALDSLLSPRKPILPGGTLRIALSQFEAALRSCGIDPRREYERVAGRPVRDLPAERVARREQSSGFRAWLAEHEVARSRPAIAAWLEDAARKGRVRADMQPLVDRALRIIAVLPPSQPTQRTVLAARMLDWDPHGLDIGTPLHGLTVSLLAAASNLDQSTPARELWSAWNVLVDPVSSNVTALNLPLSGSPAVVGMVRAMCGTHVILTYGQLSGTKLRWSDGVPCFSCENPSVLIAAEQALGRSCPPLVCTGGRPSDAVRLLFGAAHRAGAPIRHHGDFDEAGVQILRDLGDRYGAVPWRFDVDALREALLDRDGAALEPSGASLEDAVRAVASGLPEELVIDDLISDLRAARVSEPHLDRMNE
jgi:uncharacterized protein (TIGR02679 family)